VILGDIVRFKLDKVQLKRQQNSMIHGSELERHVACARQPSKATSLSGKMWRDRREGGGLVCRRRCLWKLISGYISISQCKTAQQNPLTAFLMCHCMSLRWGRKWCVGAGQDCFKGVNDCPLGEGEMRER